VGSAGPLRRCDRESGPSPSAVVTDVTSDFPGPPGPLPAPLTVFGILKLWKAVVSTMVAVFV
jgi:hypothetical protein